MSQHPPPPGGWEPPGWPPQQPPGWGSWGPQGPTTSGLAIAALIVGLVGWLAPILGGLVAVGLGIAAAAHISRSNGAKTGNGLAIAGIVLGGLGLLGWGVLLTSSSFWEGYRQAQQDSLSAGVDDLEVGDCLDFALEDSDDFRVGADDVVSCTQPHAAEYAGSTELAHASGDPYPGVDDLLVEAFDLCLDVYVDHVGRQLSASPDLDIFVAYPQELAWRAFGDRQVDCFVTTLDGSPLDGPVGRGQPASTT